MRVLLTGATGRIGQQVLRKLVERGNNVCVLVRPESSAGAKQIQSLKRLNGVTVVRSSLFDIEALKRAARGVDVICHLAWATGPERERSDVAAAMLRLTENLLKVSVETGAGFVFLSSVSVYGPENKYVSGPIKENAPLSGMGLYARSKIEAEMLVRRFSADYGLSFIVLRASLVYGPDVPYIERFVNQVLTHPFLSVYRNDKDRIQLIHLRDVAEAVVLSAMKFNGNINGTFNVAGTEVLSQAELAEVVNGCVLRPSNLRRSTLPMRSRFQSACQLKYDISKVREILGFVPRVNLQQGFSEILLARGRNRNPQIRP